MFFIWQKSRISVFLQHNQSGISVFLPNNQSGISVNAKKKNTKNLTKLFNLWFDDFILCFAVSKCFFAKYNLNHTKNYQGLKIRIVC